MMLSRLLRSSRHQRVVLLIIVICLGILGWCLFIPRHVVLNISGSMPVGIYRKLTASSIHVGDIVAVCLPKALEQVGLKQHYLTGSRTCPYGAAPVVKQVIAVPGQKVTLSAQKICVDTRCYPAPAQRNGITGDPVRRTVPLGEHKATGYWLYGAHSPDASWDSRYYGGVHRHAIQAVLRPLWTKAAI